MRWRNYAIHGITALRVETDLNFVLSIFNKQRSSSSNFIYLRGNSVKNKRIVIGTIIATGLTIVFVLLLIWNGIILLNNPSEKQYPVRGVDVSAYQGDID